MLIANAQTQIAAFKHQLPPTSRIHFRNRYDDLETRRNLLVTRLRALGNIGITHPGCKRALTLLNETFRKSRLAQRLAVLQAAASFIDLLVRITSIF
jgi:hypothetical protein